MVDPGRRVSQGSLRMCTASNMGVSMYYVDDGLRMSVDYCGIDTRLDTTRQKIDG